MKRIISLLAGFALLLSLSACAGNDTADQTSSTENTPAAPRLVAPTMPPGWDTEFLASVDARRESILNSETGIKKSDAYVPGETYTGTAYYVSNDGSDDNSGMSPETPWASTTRVNEAELHIGDAVFFRRGDVWRAVLWGQEGVTYSAYGEGAKPCFYGSQENGTGADKWTLYAEGADGAKIWQFHRQVTDCGGVVFNGGESYASRVYADWDGSHFISFKHPGEVFDVTADLDSDLQFACIFDVSGLSLPIYVYDEDTTGDLYLRCDSGNPGEIYSSIEFQTAPYPAAGYSGIVEAPEYVENGCVFDNLCVMYGSCVGIASHNASHLLVQNCEIAWAGGNTHEFNGSGYVPVAGEGIKMEGSDNTVRNCYVHDCFDGGIISETGLDTLIPYMENQTIQGNVIERCMSGVLVVHYDEENVRFGNFVIEDNYILDSGYGWSGDPNYDYTWRSPDYEGTAITFWDMPDKNGGIHIRGNVLYRAKSALLHAGMKKEYQPEFSGNTYVQDARGSLAYWPQDPDHNFSWNISGLDIEVTVQKALGDETGTVFPLD